MRTHTYFVTLRNATERNPRAMAEADPAEAERQELGFYLETVRGKSLRVIERAVPSSELCVFFVHGGGGRAGQFKHQIRRLEKDYNVVALDFLGHGGSPAPNEPRLYTVNEHLEDLKAVYEARKKRRNALIGHCYGALHTLHLMKWLRDEGRAEEVVGVAMMSLGSRAPVSVGLLGKLPAFILEWLRPLARSSSNRALFTPQTDPSLIQSENYMSNFNRMYVMKVIGADCSDNEMWTTAIREGADALGDIPRISLYGTEDGVFTEAACREAAQALGVGEGAWHPLQGTGHLCMLEAHKQVSDICQKFITSLNEQ